MTPKYRSADLLDSSALDLIRQLDQSLAQANAGIVEASREAESATQNAHLAAEIRRRFVAKQPQDSNITSSSSQPATTYYQTTYSPNTTTTNHDERTTTISPNNIIHSRFAAAHAEEIVDLTAHLEHVKSQLEHEMMHHQDTQAKLSCAKATIDTLNERLEQAERQMEAMSISQEQAMDEKNAELEAANLRAQQESEDAEYAMELAKQKIAQEQEMRSVLQQVLEKNEEYRQYIAEHCNNSTKKIVSFRDPIDDLSQQNHRALVVRGRELFHQQQEQEKSPGKQVTHALNTCQATAAVLKQSGQKLGCWEDENVTISDEVQLERLARNYANAVELQISQQRKSIQELESFCALLEQS